MSRLLRFSVVSVVALSCLVLAVSAQATTFVVGSPLAAEFKSKVSVSGLFSTIANTALGEKGANVTSPFTGTIVRWRTKGAFAGGFRLRVLRPTAGGNYVGAGASSYQTPVGASLQTFATNLPIQAGDLIGLDSEKESATYGLEGGGKSTYTLWSPPVPEGSSVAPLSSSAGEVGFDAEVEVPPPTILLIGPSSGPLAGGTTVTIAGREFDGATAVKFGPNAASANFTVISENEITAVSPPAAEPGTVDVTVTTAKGTSLPVPGDKFTYTGPALPPIAQPTPAAPVPVASCTVPNLLGKSLEKAKKSLRRAKCGLGKVRKAKGITAATGHVTKQGPKPGSSVAQGTKVNVKLG